MLGGFERIVEESNPTCYYPLARIEKLRKSSHGAEHSTVVCTSSELIVLPFVTFFPVSRSTYSGP